MREQLHRYFTQILELSPNANDPWVWELLEAASLPAKAAKLKAEAVTRILKRNRIRKWTGSEVVEILGKPSVRVADGAAEAASEHVLLLIKQLQLVAGQRADVAARSQALLDQSLPETGVKDAPERTQQHVTPPSCSPYQRSGGSTAPRFSAKPGRRSLTVIMTHFAPTVESRR